VVFGSGEKQREKRKREGKREGARLGRLEREEKTGKRGKESFFLRPGKERLLGWAKREEKKKEKRGKERFLFATARQTK